MNQEIPPGTLESFLQIVGVFGSESQSDQLFKMAEKLYCIKPFKIKKVTSKQAKAAYIRLQKKYETKQLTATAFDWHKNQRKLFVWYLICFCQIHQLKPTQISQERWEQMVPIFFNKDPMLLKFQGYNIMKSDKKLVWSESDDQNLIKQVNKYVKKKESGNWNQISKALFFNEENGKFITPKQCRERWFNHISQSVRHSEWTREEDFRILDFCKRNGKKWSKIAKTLENKRTQHMVKNRYYSLVNKKLKQKIQFLEGRVVDQLLERISTGINKESSGEYDSMIQDDLSENNEYPEYNEKQQSENQINSSEQQPQIKLIKQQVKKETEEGQKKMYEYKPSSPIIPHNTHYPYPPPIDSRWHQNQEQFEKRYEQQVGETSNLKGPDQSSSETKEKKVIHHYHHHYYYPMPNSQQPSEFHPYYPYNYSQYPPPPH